MKKNIAAACIILASFALGCSKNNEEKSQADQGTPIDSAVVGKDTSPVEVRKDIELSDPQKQALPGRDTTNSDEPQK